MDQFHLLTIIAEESLTTHIQQEVVQLGQRVTQLLPYQASICPIFATVPGQGAM